VCSSLGGAGYKGYMSPVGEPGPVVLSSRYELGEALVLVASAVGVAVLRSEGPGARCLPTSRRARPVTTAITTGMGPHLERPSCRPGW